jgi:hypothetical protein
MDTPVHRFGRASAAALAMVFALAACGGGDDASDETTPAAAPTLPRALAEELAGASDDVAERLEEGDDCAASDRAVELRDQTLAAVESGDVPAELEDPLVSAVEDLASRITCEPATTEEDEDDENERGKGKGKEEEKKDEDDDQNSTTTTTTTTETGTEIVATTTEER